MTTENRWVEIDGIRIVLAENPAWPSPANVFVITDRDEFALIDAGCGGPAGWDYLLGGLNHWGLDLHGLHTVVLSHSHPDHMGGMARILEKVRPTVIIHHLDVASALDPEDLVMNFDIPLARQRYMAADRAAFENFDLLASFEMYGCAMSAAARVEGVAEGDMIRLGGFSFEVVHTPGHSPGHMALFDADNGLLLSGDLVGNRPAWYTPTAGGVSGYLESLDKIEALDASIVLPSHGRPIEDPSSLIGANREWLLNRDRSILNALEQGPLTFMELNAVLFPEASQLFFPGCGITESHLLRLEDLGEIRIAGRKVEKLKSLKV